MCGRYTLAEAAALIERFGVPRSARDIIDLVDRYNVAPTQQMPVVIRSAEEAPGTNHLTLMDWGLVPSWSKDPARAGFINARIEGILTKPSFRESIRKRRCLVPANGFYEWKKEKSNGKLVKVPWLIRRKDQALFAFAGIYDEWRGEAGEVAETFAILTTAPNELMKSIHDRMPVILSNEQEAEWLETPAEQIDQLIEKLTPPCPADALEALVVSTKINSPANDSLDLLSAI
jgi:putative SOS response-associated peptidase YedK